jgi:hypothetical protein
VGNCLQVQQKVKLRKRKFKRREEKRKKRNGLEKREEEKKKKKEERKKKEEGRFATHDLDIFNQVNYYTKILYFRATLKSMQRTTLIHLPRLTNELNVLMHLKDLPETHMMTVNSRILLPG